MTARALMIQGTGSDVGKSLIVTGLCRIAQRRGLRVAPFKPQNMSNNAAATPDGGEIGRAQALQARAAGLAPRTDFNPVLLKPSSDRSAQVVVHGRVRAEGGAAEYIAGRGALLSAVGESFDRLAAEFDLILVEGAGSPAETNLREGDIANMGFARAFGVPVVLVGDIDRRGVIAALVGTRTLLDRADAAMIMGFIVNRLRGDPASFGAGIAEIARHTGWPCFGVVPWLDAAARLPQEDALSIGKGSVTPGDRVRIVAPMLSRIANFDDADPLRLEPHVDFSFVPPGRPIPRDADVILLLGTKSTLDELAFLKAQGWDVDILAHARAGGRVIGLCGGFQMLGRWVRDPAGIDGAPGEAAGLGLLDVETVMSTDKQVRPVSGTCATTAVPVTGYEIHVGITSGTALARPMLRLSDGPAGATGADGRVEGCYLHGLFASDSFRRKWLERIRADASSSLAYETEVDAIIDEIADALEASLDVAALLALARPCKQMHPNRHQS